MNTTTRLGSMLSLLLAAGCAHKAQYSSYDQTYTYPYGGGATTYENRSTTYNNSRTYSPDYSSSSTANQTYSPSYSQNSTSVKTTGNDQVLITNIRQSLNNNPNLAEVLPNIQVSAQNGTIILNGTVPSEQQKQAVETMVKSTSGVLNVNNQLQVNLSPTASKSSDKSNRTYSGGTASTPGDVSGSLSTESKGSANDSSASSSGSSSSLSSTNRSNQSGPSQGLPPTSDRQDLPRLYSTNNTGISTSPQSSTSGGRSAAASAGIAASQSGTSPQSPTNQSATSQGGASQAGISGSQSGTAQASGGKSDNLSSAEHKDLSASADTGQKTSIYSNGPGASVTNNASRSSLYTSAAGGAGDTSASSSNTVSQSGAENKGLSATGNAQSRRYRAGDTNSSTTASAAASTPGTFDVNVQGASQADQAIGQKVISELRADTSVAALLPTIRVKIDNGKATLSGTVKSQEEKLKIETAVQKVTGITSVDDQLRIGTSPAPIK
jgi:trimeric autotransporter adhesin